MNRLSMLLAAPPAARWILAVTLAQFVAYFVSPGPLAQLPIALVFYLSCPGVVLVEWLEIPDAPTRLALVAATSLAANSMVATLLLTLGLYSPVAGMVTVGLVSLAAAAHTTARLSPETFDQPLLLGGGA